MPASGVEGRPLKSHEKESGVVPDTHHLFIRCAPPSSFLLTARASPDASGCGGCSVWLCVARGCPWDEIFAGIGVEGRPLKSHEEESDAVRESEILRRLFGGRLASLCVVAGSLCCSRFRDGFFHGMRGELVFPVFVSFPVFVALCCWPFLSVFHLTRPPCEAALTFSLFFILLLRGLSRGRVDTSHFLSFLCTFSFLPSSCFVSSFPPVREVLCPCFWASYVPLNSRSLFSLMCFPFSCVFFSCLVPLFFFFLPFLVFSCVS